MSNLTYDQLVEKVTRAISDCEWTTDHAYAISAIAAVREAIKEPTEAMKAALATQSSDQGAEGDWRAMLAASPLNPEGK